MSDAAVQILADRLRGMPGLTALPASQNLVRKMIFVKNREDHWKINEIQKHATLQNVIKKWKTR